MSVDPAAAAAPAPVPFDPHRVEDWGDLLAGRERSRCSLEPVVDPDVEVRAFERDLALLRADALGRAAAEAGAEVILATEPSEEEGRALASWGVVPRVSPGGVDAGTVVPAHPRVVRSVQRLPPSPVDAPALARLWYAWLETRTPFHAHASGHQVVLGVAGLPAIRLEEVVREPTRSAWRVRGGLFAGTGHRASEFEFRLVLGRCATLVALHDFVPALPWFGYRITQGPLHERLIATFGRSLGRA